MRPKEKDISTEGVRNEAKRSDRRVEKHMDHLTPILKYIRKWGGAGVNFKRERETRTHG